MSNTEKLYNHPSFVTNDSKDIARLLFDHTKGGTDEGNTMVAQCMLFSLARRIPGIPPIVLRDAFRILESMEND